MKKTILYYGLIAISPFLVSACDSTAKHGGVLSGDTRLSMPQELSSSLSDNDRQAIENAYQDAAWTNRPVSWRGEDSSAQGRVFVIKKETATHVVDIPHKEEAITPPTDIGMIASFYQTTSPVMIYSGPDTSYPVIDNLPAGETLYVAGRYLGGTLESDPSSSPARLLAMQDGVAVGYVIEGTISPLSREESRELLSEDPSLNEEDSDETLVENSDGDSSSSLDIAPSTAYVKTTCKQLLNKMNYDSDKVFEDKRRLCLGLNGWEEMEYRKDHIIPMLNG